VTLLVAEIDTHVPPRVKKHLALAQKGTPAEFFAKPILCFSDSIGVESQHVAAGKVS